MKAIMHKECNGIAYYCDDRKYIPNEQISHTWLYHLDKSNCELYEVMKCGKHEEYIHFELIDGDIEARNGNIE